MSSVQLCVYQLALLSSMGITTSNQMVISSHVDMIVLIIEGDFEDVPSLCSDSWSHRLQMSCWAFTLCLSILTPAAMMSHSHTEYELCRVGTHSFRPKQKIDQGLGDSEIWKQGHPGIVLPKGFRYAVSWQPATLGQKQYYTHQNHPHLHKTHHLHHPAGMSLPSNTYSITWRYMCVYVEASKAFVRFTHTRWLRHAVELVCKISCIWFKCKSIGLKEQFPQKWTFAKNVLILIPSKM